MLPTKQNTFLHILQNTSFNNTPSNRPQKFILSIPHNKISACEPIQVCEAYSHQLINGTTSNAKEILTDIIHRIICRIQRLAINRQREKTPERCFAPLKIRVDGYELSGDVVSCCWCDPCAKSGRGGHCCAREFDTNGASARLGVVAVQSLGTLFISWGCDLRYCVVWICELGLSSVKRMI